MTIGTASVGEQVAVKFIQNPFIRNSEEGVGLENAKELFHSSTILIRSSKSSWKISFISRIVNTFATFLKNIRMYDKRDSPLKNKKFAYDIKKCS